MQLDTPTATRSNETCNLVLGESVWRRYIHRLKQSLLSEQTFKYGLKEADLPTESAFLHNSLVSKSVILLMGFQLNAWNKVCGN